MTTLLLAVSFSVPAFAARLSRPAKRHRHTHVLSRAAKSSYRGGKTGAKTTYKAGKTGARATYKAGKTGTKKVVHVTKKVV